MVIQQGRARTLQSQFARMWPELWNPIDFSPAQPDLHTFEEWLVERRLTTRPNFANLILEPQDWEKLPVPYKLYDTALAFEQSEQKRLEEQIRREPLAQWDQLQAAIPTAQVHYPEDSGKPGTGSISLSPAGMGTTGRLPPPQAHAMQLDPTTISIFQSYTLKEVASLARAFRDLRDVIPPTLILARKYLFYRGHTAAAHMPVEQVRDNLMREVTERVATSDLPVTPPTGASPARPGKGQKGSGPAGYQQKQGKTQTMQHMRSPSQEEKQKRKEEKLRLAEEAKKRAEEVKQREAEKKKKEVERKKLQAKRQKAKKGRPEQRPRFTGSLVTNVGDGSPGMVKLEKAALNVPREISQYFMDVYPDELEIKGENIRVPFPYAQAPNVVTICDEQEWRGGYVPHPFMILRQERSYKDLTLLWHTTSIGQRFSWARLKQPTNLWKHMGVFVFGPLTTTFSLRCTEYDFPVSDLWPVLAFLEKVAQIITKETVDDIEDLLDDDHDFMATLLISVYNCLHVIRCHATKQPKRFVFEPRTWIEEIIFPTYANLFLAKGEQPSSSAGQIWPSGSADGTGSTHTPYVAEETSTASPQTTLQSTPGVGVSPDLVQVALQLTQYQAPVGNVDLVVAPLHRTTQLAGQPVGEQPPGQIMAEDTDKETPPVAADEAREETQIIDHSVISVSSQDATLEKSHISVSSSGENLDTSVGRPIEIPDQSVIELDVSGADPLLVDPNNRECELLDYDEDEDDEDHPEARLIAEKLIMEDSDPEPQEDPAAAEAEYTSQDDTGQEVSDLDASQSLSKDDLEEGEITDDMEQAEKEKAVSQPAPTTSQSETESDTVSTPKKQPRKPVKDPSSYTREDSAKFVVPKNIPKSTRSKTQSPQQESPRQHRRILTPKSKAAVARGMAELGQARSRSEERRVVFPSSTGYCPWPPDSGTLEIDYEASSGRTVYLMPQDLEENKKARKNSNISGFNDLMVVPRIGGSHGVLTSYRAGDIITGLGLYDQEMQCLVDALGFDPTEHCPELPNATTAEKAKFFLDMMLRPEAPCVFPIISRNTEYMGHQHHIASPCRIHGNFIIASTTNFGKGCKQDKREIDSVCPLRATKGCRWKSTNVRLFGVHYNLSHFRFPAVFMCPCSPQGCFYLGPTITNWTEHLERRHNLYLKVDRSLDDLREQQRKDIESGKLPEEDAKPIRVPNKCLRAHERLWREYMSEGSKSQKEVKRDVPVIRFYNHQALVATSLPDILDWAPVSLTNTKSTRYKDAMKALDKVVKDNNLLMYDNCPNSIRVRLEVPADEWTDLEKSIVSLLGGTSHLKQSAEQGRDQLQAWQDAGEGEEFLCPRPGDTPIPEDRPTTRARSGSRASTRSTTGSTPDTVDRPPRSSSRTSTGSTKRKSDSSEHHSNSRPRTTSPPPGNPADVYMQSSHRRRSLEERLGPEVSDMAITVQNDKILPMDTIETLQETRQRVSTLDDRCWTSPPPHTRIQSSSSYEESDRSTPYGTSRGDMDIPFRTAYQERRTVTSMAPVGPSPLLTSTPTVVRGIPSPKQSVPVSKTRPSATLTLSSLGQMAQQMTAAPDVQAELASLRRQVVDLQTTNQKNQEHIAQLQAELRQQRELAWQSRLKAEELSSKLQKAESQVHLLEMQAQMQAQIQIQQQQLDQLRKQQQQLPQQSPLPTLPSPAYGAMPSMSNLSTMSSPVRFDPSMFHPGLPVPSAPLYPPATTIATTTSGLPFTTQP